MRHRAVFVVLVFGEAELQYFGQFDFCFLPFGSWDMIGIR